MLESVLLLTKGLSKYLVGNIFVLFNDFLYDSIPAFMGVSQQEEACYEQVQCIS
jgi:hypothetical protein